MIEHYGVVVVAVVGGVEERDHGVLRHPGLEGSKGGIGEQFCTIALFKFGPAGGWILMKPFAKLGRWRQILDPGVVMKGLVRKPSGPQTVDIHSVAVGRRGRVVGSLELNRGRHGALIYGSKLVFAHSAKGA